MDTKDFNEILSTKYDTLKDLQLDLLKKDNLIIKMEIALNNNSFGICHIMNNDEIFLIGFQKAYQYFYITQISKK